MFPEGGDAWTLIRRPSRADADGTVRSLLQRELLRHGVVRRVDGVERDLFEEPGLAKRRHRRFRLAAIIGLARLELREREDIGVLRAAIILDRDFAEAFRRPGLYGECDVGLVRAEVDDDFPVGEFRPRMSVVLEKGQRGGRQIDDALRPCRPPGLQSERRAVLRQCRHVGRAVGINDLEAVDHGARTERHLKDDVETAALRLLDRHLDATVVIGFRSQHVVEPVGILRRAAAQLAERRRRRRLALAELNVALEEGAQIVGYFRALDARIEIELRGRPDADLLAGRWLGGARR